MCEKEVSCSVCKLSQPLYTINIDSVHINITEQKGDQKELSAEKIKNLLDRVSNMVLLVFSLFNKEKELIEKKSIIEQAIQEIGLSFILRD